MRLASKVKLNPLHVNRVPVETFVGKFSIADGDQVEWRLHIDVDIVLTGEMEIIVEIPAALAFGLVAAGVLIGFLLR